MHFKTTLRAGMHAAAALVLSAGAAVQATAQTIQLTDSSATVVRGGSYASTNLASDVLLSTRASSDATYTRRILLKFDTQNTIPADTPIASATLTVTVSGGNAEARSVAAYRISSVYDEEAATWVKRNSTDAWSQSGGDLAERYGSATVSSVSGSTVAFNVTALVQSAVNGSFGSSRYSRIALVDTGSSTKDSYKEYFSDEAADSSVRPRLTVIYGSAAPAPPPAPTPTTSGETKLRVLMWNIHHGVGTDGKYNLDRLATWMAKMTPDFIMLNEVEKYTGWGNEDQPARFEAMLEAKTGRRWYRHFAQEFGNWSSSGKGHLMLSVYPLESTGYVEITPSDGLKGAGAASQVRIVVNGRTINFVLTHLDPESQAMRLIQARDSIRWAASFAENRILGGDMNAWPDQSSIAELRKTYNDSWSVAEQNGTAVGFSGLYPAGATKSGRIDYIFSSKTAPNLAVLGSRVYDTRDSSGVRPSDHRPVLTTFAVR